MRQPSTDRVINSMGSHYAMTCAYPGAYVNDYTLPIVVRRTHLFKAPAYTDNFGLVKRLGQRLGPLPYRTFRRETDDLFGTRQVSSKNSKGEEFVSEIRNGHQSWSYASPVFQHTVSEQLIACDRKARAKLLASVKDSKFNAAQAYAEAGQVHKMIGTFAVKTAEALTKLRRGDLVGAGRAVGLTMGKRAATRYRRKHAGIKTKDDIDQMLASGVLAIQYGVRPLIQDVIGAAETFSQKMVREVVNSSQASANSSVTEIYRNDPIPGFRQQAIQTINCNVTYGCTFAKGSEALHTLKQLGLTNPLLLAWELMPWSFVIDWVLPVGDYLSSLDATLGLDFIDGYVSTKFEITQTRYQGISIKPFSGVGEFISEQSSGRNYEKEFTRSVLKTFPLPQLPTFKNPVSIEHAINGIALLAGFKKKVYSR